MPAFLLDTNVLLRLVDPSAENHQAAAEAITRLRQRNQHCLITPQVVIEFWAVVTRPPAANGLGWSTARARSEVDRLLDLFALLDDAPTAFHLWLALVTSLSILSSTFGNIAPMFLSRPCCR